MIWDILVLGTIGLMIPTAVGLGVWHQLKRWKGIRRTSEHGLLNVVKASRLPIMPRLTARSGPVEFRIRMKKEEKVKVVATVDGPPELAQLVIRREILKLPGTRDIDMGDEDFDFNFVVQGPLPFVCALLDAQTRRTLLKAHADTTAMEMKIADGKLRTEVDEDRLPGVISLFRDLGERLARNGDDIPRRLLDNVRFDSKPGVRLLNLLTLVREFPGDPHTEKALHVGCNDADLEIRLRSAVELGSDGEETLLELARRVDDDAISARAVTALGRSLSLESALALLAHAEEHRMLGTARACLEVLGSLGSVAVGALAEVMARDIELATAAVRGLGATGDPAAEPPLLAALARDYPDRQVGVAVAEALGRVGSVDSVLPLQEAAEGAPRGSDLRRAARQAAAEIQARLAGATPGQLSLAATEAGQLSLAFDEAGQLSIAPHAVGEASPPPPPPGVPTRSSR